MNKTNVGGLPHGSYIVTDDSAVIAALQERIADLESQIEFKIKECQELASACHHWKTKAHNELKDALKEQGE